ncbi:MAG: DUF896 domain-containing protein [Clostridia bacterium]|nr:DUF896 domain-containing protein [Clostridia bacterium]
MEKEKLDRINFLARKAKETELTPEEKEEQGMLRGEYLAEIRMSFGTMLDHTVIQRPDGSKQPLHKSDKAKH